MAAAIRVPALKVHQWLSSWGTSRPANKPGDGIPSAFYCFVISAAFLRALTGVHRRTAKGPRAEDKAIQRRHDPNRSAEIARYLRSGLLLAPAQKPPSELSKGTLQMPGWLPTAIVVNILDPSDRRNRNQRVHEADRVTVADGPDRVSLKLPDTFDSRAWRPRDGFLHPIEVIDGQHRLWAFNDEELPDDFELPVVAFFGLAIRWQAYLFWSINVKPKRINPSLAYDLYPILRRDEWLSITEDVQVYRDTRAQEIVEGLWSLSYSPFKERINMLGERGQGGVTQAAWIRSLTATFIKSWTSKRLYIGGLFGSTENEAETELPWNRAQQTALLIYIFNELFFAIAISKPSWVTELDDEELIDDLKSSETLAKPVLDIIFSASTLLNQDQGIRPILNVFNDMLFLAADRLDLYNLFSDDDEDSPGTDSAATEAAIEQLRQSSAGRYVRNIAAVLADYDWRNSTHPGLSEAQRLRKQALRGSGGYRILRLELLELLQKSSAKRISAAAAEIVTALGA